MCSIFYASRLPHHHAWARLDDGCVTRAYAWSGETVWNQGIETLPETEADMKCPATANIRATMLDAEMNFEKVPQLAARWSLDPAEVKLHSRLSPPASRANRVPLKIFIAQTRRVGAECGNRKEPHVIQHRT